MPRTRHRNDGLRKICGCPRATWPRCPHSWHLNFHYGGHPYRLSLDKEVGRPVISKAEARAEADRIRGEIRAGRFAQRDRSTDDSSGAQRGQPGAVLERLTVAHLLDTYYDRYVLPERTDTKDVRYRLEALKRTELPRPDGLKQPFGNWLVFDVTTDTIERCREIRRLQALRSDPNGANRLIGGVVTTNRDLAFLRAAWNWAIRLGYVEKTPFKRGSETVIKLARELPRSRRLEGDEDDRLFTASGPHLRAAVEAALETGARKGELLSLQWAQIKEGPRPAVFFPAKKTKTKRDRYVPISSRLQMLLDMRRHDASGRPMPPHAYVFGNEIGERVKSKKSAWILACKRAGITNLHFHDLRREAGSRWLEGGVPLQTVRDWLGHTNIAQTSTYLGSTILGQHDAMRRFEEQRAAARERATVVTAVAENPTRENPTHSGSTH